MIFTSYFRNIKNLPDNVIPVSIARFTDEGIEVLECKKLAPASSIISEYKRNIITDFFKSVLKFTHRYEKEILSKFNINEVIKELEELTGVKDVATNPDRHIALCSSEHPDNFSHRHLISRWFKMNGYSVEEYGVDAKEVMRNVPKKKIAFKGETARELFDYKNEEFENYNKLQDKIYQLVEKLFKKYRYVEFITGAMPGIDHLAFRAVDDLKHNYPYDNDNIKNTLYQPCFNHSSNWDKKGIFGQDYFKDNILDKADESIYVCKSGYYQGVMEARNKRIVSDADMLIAFYPGNDWKDKTPLHKGLGCTIKEAYDKGIDIILVGYDEIELPSKNGKIYHRMLLDTLSITTIKKQM